MADAVTSQILFNGPRHLVYRFTNESDGTGEAAVLKVDATSNTNGVFYAGQNYPSGLHLKIVRVRYDIRNMGLRIQWVASSAQDALVLSGFNTLDFLDSGGIQNPGTAALPGATGSIQFTTVGAAVGSGYFVDLYMTKGVPQS